MTTQPRFPCLVLYALLLFSMGIFAIDTAALLEGPSLGQDRQAPGNAPGRLNQVVIPAIFLLSGLMLLSDGAARRQLLRRPGIPLFFLITTLVLIASISVSDHTMLTIKRSGSQLLFLASALFLVLVIPDKRRLYLTIGMAFLTALVIDVALYITLGTGFSAERGFIGYNGNKNMAGNQYGVATMVFLYLAISRKAPLFLLATIASAALLLMSESRTSIGAVGVFLVFSLVYGQPLARGIIVLLTLIGALSLSIMFSVGGNDPEWFTGRGEIWNFLAPRVWDKPFFGYGFSSFWDVGGQALNLTEGAGLVEHVNTAHNGFIDVLLGTGLFGLSAFAAFLVLVALMLAQLDSRYFLAHYIFIALMISNITESYLLYYQNVMWLVFVLIVGAAYAESRKVGRRRPVMAVGR